MPAKLRAYAITTIPCIYPFSKLSKAKKRNRTLVPVKSASSLYSLLLTHYGDDTEPHSVSLQDRGLPQPLQHLCAYGTIHLARLSGGRYEYATRQRRGREGRTHQEPPSTTRPDEDYQRPREDQETQGGSQVCRQCGGKR